MTHEAEAFHRAADDIEATNRWIKRASTVALIVVIAAMVTVLIWAVLAFGSEVSTIRSRQIEFHHDSTCQTQALDQILIELHNAQEAQAAGQPVTRFTYPKPC